MKEIEIKTISINKAEELLILFEKYQHFYEVSLSKKENKKFIKEILRDNNKGIFHIIYLDSEPAGFSGVYFSYSSVLAKKNHHY